MHAPGDLLCSLQFMRFSALRSSATRLPFAVVPLWLFFVPPYANAPGSTFTNAFISSGVPMLTRHQSV